MRAQSCCCWETVWQKQVGQPYLQTLPGLMGQHGSLALQAVNAHVVVHLLLQVGGLSGSLGRGRQGLAVQGMQLGQVDSRIGGIVAEACHRAAAPVWVCQQHLLQAGQAGQVPHLHAKHVFKEEAEELLHGMHVEQGDKLPQSGSSRERLLQGKLAR